MPPPTAARRSELARDAKVALQPLVHTQVLKRPPQIAGAAAQRSHTRKGQAGPIASLYGVGGAAREGCSD